MCVQGGGRGGGGININSILVTADRPRPKATSTGEQTANTKAPDFFPDTNPNHLQLRWGGEGRGVMGAHHTHDS